MSLPAYMYIYDENGQQIKGSCLSLGREGSIEIMNSGYSMNQVTCSSTGKLIIEWFYIDGNIKYDDDWSRPVGYNRQQQQKRITTAVSGYLSHSLSTS